MMSGTVGRHYIAVHKLAAAPPIPIDIRIADAPGALQPRLLLDVAVRDGESIAAGSLVVLDDLIRQRRKRLSSGGEITRIGEVRRPLSDGVLLRFVRGGCDLVRCLLRLGDGAVDSVRVELSHSSRESDRDRPWQPSIRGSCRRRVRLCLLPEAEG